jgi:hypothetical protein
MNALVEQEQVKAVMRAIRIAGPGFNTRTVHAEYVQQSDTGESFLQVVLFPLDNHHSTTALHSSITIVIIRVWYRRPN